MATAAQKQQIVNYLAAAGFTGADLVTATAIVLRESGGNPQAFNGNTKTGDESYGLFQINMLGSLGPSRLKAFGLTDKNQLLDPLTNARAAYQMFQQSGFHAWLGYRPGLTVDPQMAQAQKLVAAYDPAAAASIRTGLGEGVALDAGGRSGSPSIAADHPPLDDPTSYAIGAGMGWVSALLSNPEVGKVLRAAAASNATPAQLQAAIMGTNWWREHQASIREFDTNMTIDPATMNAQIQSKMAELQTRSASLGYVIDPGHLRDLAIAALRLNLGDQEIVNAIGAEAAREGNLGGSGTHQSVRQMASDYGVPLSDQAAGDWTTNIATGASTLENLRQNLGDQAKGLFPGFADGIDRGLTVKTLADPYIQLAAKDLGVAPETITFDDPRWAGVLTGDDPSGGRRVLGLDEFQRKYRGDSSFGWQNTANAKSLAYGFISTLGRNFGEYA